jgi:peptidoglycan-N-acetylglucosamine deacetylase
MAHPQGRETSRLQARGQHEDRHVRQLVEVITNAANAPESANTGAKSAQEKPQAAGERQECKEQGAFGPGRVLTLDTRGGGEYGLVSFRNTLALNPGEVVFTFDDGPHPNRTPQILDILDRYCVKAVFFMIGEMAERSPELVREIKRRGHTIGAHTWSHPVHLGYLSEQRAEDEIEHGFAAVNQAAGEPIAPFFRFPGLGHTRRLLDYTAQRDIAVWSVDVVSGDSEGASGGRIPSLVWTRLEKHGRGILLFHDIKKTTVEALPRIIEMLRDRNYHAVQVIPDTPFSADPALIARLNARRNQAAELRSRWRYR